MQKNIFFGIPDTRWFWKQIGYGSGIAKNYRVWSGIGYPSVTAFDATRSNLPQNLYFHKSNLPPLQVHIWRWHQIKRDIFQVFSTTTAATTNRSHKNVWLLRCFGTLAAPVWQRQGFTSKPWSTSRYNSTLMWQDYRYDADGMIALAWWPRPSVLPIFQNIFIQILKCICPNQKCICLNLFQVCQQAARAAAFCPAQKPPYSYIALITMAINSR